MGVGYWHKGGRYLGCKGVAYLHLVRSYLGCSRDGSTIEPDGFMEVVVDRFLNWVPLKENHTRKAK